MGEGHNVTIIDNFSTSSFESIKSYTHKLILINSDLKEMSDDFLLSIFEQQDIIYHLAGSVGVSLGDKKPKDTLFNNVGLANKLIPLFDKAKKHVVFSSTSEVYGNGPTFQEEDFAGIGPSSKTRWGYSCSKLLTEFMLRASDCPHTIVRFFNVVGPGQLGDYGMVLPRFVQSAKAGEDLTVYGDGNMVRSFCHVEDMIDTLLEIQNDSGELYNLGNNDEPVTMLELANRVIKVAEAKSKIQMIPYSEAFSKKFEDIMYRVPNLDKLKRRIDYKPKYNLDAIIRDML